MAYGDYLEQRNYPQEQLNFALGALQGVPYETRTIGIRARSTICSITKYLWTNNRWSRVVS